MSGIFAGWSALFACVSLGLAEGAGSPDAYPDNCTVVWETPSTDSLGSMPLGNGDIGLNVWTEPESGSLVFYISKVDAFDARGCLFKLGKIGLTLTPNPFAGGNRFRQALLLREGAIEITTGSGATETRLRLWVDANRPVVKITGETPVSTEAVIVADWVQARPYGVSGARAVDQANSRLPGLKLDDQQDRLAWAFRNNASTWKERLVAQKQQGFAEKARDPLLNLTSGCLVKGAGFVRAQTADTLKLKEKRRTFDVSVHVLTCQTDKMSEWFTRLEQQALEAERGDPAVASAAHREWWQSFWNRSAITVEACGKQPVRLEGYRFSPYSEAFRDYVKGLEIDSATNAFQLTQRYALERFLQACAGRSSVPPPFNGSIFTMDLPAGTHGFGGPRKKVSGANHRDWGGLPFFWQNTRHPGWSMLARGDFDTLLPSFRLIRDSLEVSKDRARQWFGHDGAFMTEGIMPGGVSIFNKLPGHLTYHWLGTIEMTAMMCDYFEHTQDEKFLKETLLPCADEFVKFYELHFPKRDAKGKMIMAPAGTVETYQPVTNPVTEVSGLRYLLGRLLSFDDALVGAERKAYWKRVAALLPDVPWRTVRGLELLAPGEKYEGRLICETPELYAVWPFRQAALGGDEALLARARQSFHVRQLSLDGTPDSQSWETGGWQPAPIWAACLGLPREAARLVSINFDDRFPNIADNVKMSPPVPGHPRARFPGFWETKMDYTPDNDHGAVSANALQSLLLQSDGKRIFLLPAWPEDWDVSFKLHAPFNTTVECVYRHGKVQSLVVTPEARRADIVDFSSCENRIRTLVGVAAADCNWLFGLPPMLDGLPEPGPTTGLWLERYGESVKDVRGTPWPCSVFRDKTLYVFGLDGNEPAVPRVPATQRSVTRLDAGKDSPVAILKLEYDRPLEEVIRTLAAEGSLTSGKKASPEGVIDLGQEATVDRIELTIENPGHRRGSPKAFTVEVRQADGTWRTVCKGNVYGTLFSKRIEPVQAKQVRVTCQAPMVRFDLFPAGSVARAWPDRAPEGCPFPKSDVVTGLVFTGRRAEYTQADTWYFSRAADGNQYSPFTDGFVGSAPKCVSAAPAFNVGCARIEGGDPLALKVVPLGLRKAPGAPYKGRYPCGSLVYKGVWYYGTYCLATHKYPYDILGPFVGFDVSRDFGKTWMPTPRTPLNPLFGETFAPFAGHAARGVEEVLDVRRMTDGEVDAMPKVKMGAPHFVDFGKELEHSPDGKAYLVGHGAVRKGASCSWISGDQVYLARVAPSPETINDAGSYEFFAGRDAQGRPLWTRTLADCKPLLEWDDHLGCVTATWNPALKRFLMCVTNGGKSGMDANDTLILEAPELTGPWRRVAWMDNFGDQAYFVNVPSAFISGDGLTLWLCYSANYAPKNKRVANPPGSGYWLCLQEVRLSGTENKVK